MSGGRGANLLEILTVSLMREDTRTPETTGGSQLENSALSFCRAGQGRVWGCGLNSLAPMVVALVAQLIFSRVTLKVLLVTT